MKRVVTNSPFLQAEYEIMLVKSHIVFRALQDVLTYEISQLKRNAAGVGLKMPQIIIKKLEQNLDYIIKEQFKLRQTLAQNDHIKIVSTELVRDGGGGLVASYLCRGYEYQMRLLGDTLKAECKVMMAAMFGVDLTEDQYAEKEE